MAYATYDLRLQARAGSEYFALEKYTVMLAPPNVEPGNVIGVLHGYKVLLALRQQCDKWSLMGSCYIDGIMFGEAVTWDQDEVNVFEII